MVTQHITFRILSVILMVSGLLLAGCKDKNPFIPKPGSEKDNNNNVTQSDVQDVAFIYDDNIFLKSDMTQPADQITFDSYNTKEDVKISYDGSKIAYRNSSNEPVIIDNNGQVLNTLSSYAGFTSMEWASNNQTLCILQYDSIHFHGPEVSIPEIYQPQSYSTKDVIDFSISANNDLAYVVVYDNSNYEAFAIENGNSTVVDQYGYTEPYDYDPKEVNFSGNGSDLVIAFEEEDYGGQWEYDMYKDLTGSAELSYTFGHDLCYRSDLNYVVMRSEGTDGDYFTYDVVSAIRTLSGSEYDDDNIYDSNYSGVSSVDWK